jgi:DNA polymerase III alpha subunit
MTKIKDLVFCNPHQHIASFDTGSTIEAFCEREIELGRKYLTTTEHGSMSAARKLYDLCKNGKYKGKLSPILGIEAYFRDSDDEVLIMNGINPDEYNTFNSKKLKYSHITIHFPNESAFKAGVSILSKRNMTAERHGSENKPIFNWEDLEVLGAAGCTFGSSCLIGIAARHILSYSNFDIAEKYYQKIRSVAKPGNFIVELFPHKCDKNFESCVYLTTVSGNKMKFYNGQNLYTSEGKISAEDLARQFSRDSHSARKRHGLLRGKMVARKEVELPPEEIVDVVQFEGEVHNECTPASPNGDVQLTANKFILKMAEKYQDPILWSFDSHLASPEDKIVQDVKLSQGGGNFKFVTSYHVLTNEEIYKYGKDVLGLSDSKFEEYSENSKEWASKFDNFQLNSKPNLPTKFYPSDSIAHLKSLIESVGRMPKDNSVYTQRLDKEIEVLTQNGMDWVPYFFLGSEVNDIYLKNGKIPGPGRGSAGGVLLAYLIGLTHVDPIKWDLSFDRFITPDRILSGAYPDIDQDLPDAREELIDEKIPENGWLRKRFGDNCFQISTENKLRLKSSIKDVARMVLGEVPAEIHELTKNLPNTPPEINDIDFVFGYHSEEGFKLGLSETNPALKTYISKYPEQWAMVSKCIGATRSLGRHAAAFAFSNDPINDYIPTTIVGGVPVTEWTKDQVESAGAIKIDLLALNTLKQIQSAITLIQDRHSPEIDWADSRARNQIQIPKIKTKNGLTEKIKAVPFRGEYFDIFDLPEEKEVFQKICNLDISSVFQLDTPSSKTWLAFFKEGDKTGINSIEDLSSFIALNRPGPLEGMVKDSNGQEHNILVEFARRSLGHKKIGSIPALEEIAKKTKGLLIYQETITEVFKVLGKTTGAKAEEFRRDISKKKAGKIVAWRKLFIEGATTEVGAEQAEEIWNLLVKFLSYGFNRSHSIAYAHITYATAFLKTFYPLEWWCAVLQNSTSKKIQDSLWSEVRNFSILPDLTKSSDTWSIVGETIVAPMSLIRGFAETSSELISKIYPIKDLGDFFKKVQQWRIDNGQEETKIEDNQLGMFEVKTVKLAKNPIGKALLEKLLIAGVLDSAIYSSEEDTVLEKIKKYNTIVESTSIKDFNKFKIQEKIWTDIELYIERKNLNPLLGGNLDDFAEKTVLDRLFKKEKDRYFRAPINGKYEDFKIIGASSISGEDSLYEFVGEKICLFGFVNRYEKRSWTDKKTQKQRMLVGIDVEVNETIISCAFFSDSMNLPRCFQENNNKKPVAICLNLRNPFKPIACYIETLFKENI